MNFLVLSLAFITVSSCANNSNQKNRIIIPDSETSIKVSLDILEHDSIILFTGWYYVVDSLKGLKRQLDRSDELYYIDPEPISTARNFTTFEIYESNTSNRYLGLTMRLDKEGTEHWTYATQKAEANRMQLAFILDNRLLQVSNVLAPITGGVTALNRGIYSRAELENIKTLIEREK